MDELDYLRNEINEIDEELVALFLRRMEVARKVGEYKKEKGMQVFDSTREKQILDKFLGRLKADWRKKHLEEYLENLMYLSKKSQKDIIKSAIPDAPVGERKANDVKIRAGYQGVKGCYSHQTTLEYFGGSIDPVGFDSFRAVFEALDKDEIEYAVLPVENSSAGSITEVYDLLREYNFYIVGERSLKVDHNLLAIEGTELSDIKEIYSHYQGLLQCSSFIRKNPNWEPITYFDTAGSAELIKKENTKTKACIAGKNAAEVYGLNIIAENIQNSENNYTRFIIIQKEFWLDNHADKISIMVSVPHRPGTLHSILNHFAENGCDMTKIESRPMVGKPWQYFFYIDFKGNILNETIKNVLAEIEKEALYYKFLGNYR